MTWVTVPNFTKYISTNHKAEQFASKSKAKQRKMSPQNRAFCSYVSWSAFTSKIQYSHPSIIPLN